MIRLYPTHKDQWKLGVTPGGKLGIAKMLKRIAGIMGMSGGSVPTSTVGNAS